MIELKGDPVRKLYIRDIFIFKEKYPEVKFSFIMNPAVAESKSYVRMLERFAVALGVPFQTVEIQTAAEAHAAVNRANRNPGEMIIVARPLAVDGENAIIEEIDPAKDPDMLTGANVARLVRGDLSRLPGTAQSVIALLDHYRIAVPGQKALIVGRSISVGMPIFLALQRKDAFCTLAHSKVTVEKIREEAQSSDLIVLAVGRRGLIRPEDIKRSATVVDCGFHADGSGDLGFIPSCAFFTPVPGGVGPLTIAAVIKNGYYLFSNEH